MGNGVIPRLRSLQREETGALRSLPQGGEAGYCHLGPVMNPAGAVAVVAA
jgi:hypothetical protein